MTGISIDTHELVELEHDLGRVPGRAVAAVERVTEANARDIQDRMGADAANDGHFPDFANAITTDRELHLSAIGFEIGPDKDRRQGALGNILYFGTSKNAPVLDLEAPVHAQEPKFLAQLAAVAAESLR